MNNPNCYGQIVKFVSNKDHKEHEAVQFVIPTQEGEWRSGYCFPTALEMNLVKQALNPMRPIYGNEKGNNNL